MILEPMHRSRGTVASPERSMPGAIPLSQEPPPVILLVMPSHVHTAKAVNLEWLQYGIMVPSDVWDLIPCRSPHPIGPAIRTTKARTLSLVSRPSFPVYQGMQTESVSLSLKAESILRRPSSRQGSGLLSQVVDRCNSCDGARVPPSLDSLDDSDDTRDPAPAESPVSGPYIRVPQRSRAGVPLGRTIFPFPTLHRPGWTPCAGLNP